MTRVAKRLAHISAERRSPLYRWLVEHFDEVSPYLPPQASRPTTVARVASESGLKVTKQLVYSTWKRVLKDRSPRVATPTKPSPNQQRIEHARHESGSRSSFAFDPKEADKYRTTRKP